MFATMRTGVLRINNVSDPDTWFILTCTKNSFYFRHTHTVFKRVHISVDKEKKPTYLRRQSFFHGGEFPFHSGPLLKANCLVPLAFSLTPCASYLHTEHLFFHTKAKLTSPYSSIGQHTVQRSELSGKQLPVLT